MQSEGIIDSWINKQGGRGSWKKRGIDFYKSNNRGVERNREKKEREPIIKTMVKNLNMENVKPHRAGVIIYTVINDAVYFGLGLDARTHDLTDFGGGVMYKSDLNPINGALREFREETLNIFEEITNEDIAESIVLYDNRNLIIFIHMDLDPNSVSLAFNNKYASVVQQNADFSSRKSKRSSGKNDPEVCGITWITWEELQIAINRPGILYTKVQKFLANANNFGQLL